MSGQGDPLEPSWSEARRRARAQVAVALAPRARTCPRCRAVQEANPTRRCVSCGAELVARRPTPRPSRGRLVALGVAAAVLALPTTAFVMESRERAAGERRAAAAQQAAVESAERRRLEREGRPRSSPLPASSAVDVPTARSRAVRATETLITIDARARVRGGTMDGPVIGTRCSPEPPTATRRAAEKDPRAVRRAYGCVAFKSRFELPAGDGRRRVGLFGHAYRAIIDERRRSITWCRVFPPPGEGAKALAVLSLDPACATRAPESRAIAAGQDAGR